jgi:hypothetical protein
VNTTIRDGKLKILDQYKFKSLIKYGVWWFKREDPYLNECDFRADPSYDKWHFEGRITRYIDAEYYSGLWMREFQ